MSLSELYPHMGGQLFLLFYTLGGVELDSQAGQQTQIGYLRKSKNFAYIR